MYARNLLDILHRELAEPREYEATHQRFESLRGHGLLPRGRENAGRKLENEQIANAILGFAPTKPGWAGHVALILGGLRPVGGDRASFLGAPDVKASLAKLIEVREACESVINVTLSIIRTDAGDEYFAKIRFMDEGVRKTASYVSKYFLTLGSEGADASFDAELMLVPSARQLVLGRMFFRDLYRTVELSRTLDRPLKTDWREYEKEEEKQAFHKSLGARIGSIFLNIGVETQATWPQEPTRIKFGGHNFVLFPKTKDNSHSISVDLASEQLDHSNARTLISRFLSLLSWCDDQHAILREGWSGNPVPVPVPKRDLAFATAHHWAFHRSIPTDKNLLMCLARYREGLNASEAGLVTFGILSFYKVFEDEKKSGEKVKSWISREFDAAIKQVSPDSLKRFHQDRKTVDTAEYVYRNCRVATAHAAKDVPSDADASLEIGRLWNAVPILRSLARHYIRTEFKLSESYFTDNPT